MLFLSNLYFRYKLYSDLQKIPCELLEFSLSTRHLFFWFLFYFSFSRISSALMPLANNFLTTLIVRCRMTVRFSAVDEHTVSFAQLISLLLIGKFSLARQNDKSKKRHQILSLGYMWVNSLQRADLLQMVQGCPAGGTASLGICHGNPFFNMPLHFRRLPYYALPTILYGV